MQLALKLSSILIATGLAANAMDPKLLRLVAPDARIVCGVDVEQFQTSALARVHGSGLEWLSARSGIEHIRETLTIIDFDAHTQPMVVVTGPVTGSPAEDAIKLDANTVLIGDPVRAQEAIARWRKENAAVPDLVDTARRLSGSYDLWFVSARPLDLPSQDVKTVLKYRDELVKVIEEARGGIRLGGGSAAVTFEVLARTADDAATLAALGRWLPGLLQMQDPSGPIGSLVGAIENLSVRTEGRTAVATFSVTEEALEKLNTPRHVIQD
jgi:hypothetical protein